MLSLYQDKEKYQFPFYVIYFMYVFFCEDQAFPHRLSSDNAPQEITISPALVLLTLLPSKRFFFYFNKNPIKIMKNALYFILEALFVLTTLRLLPYLFGHV